MCIVEHRLNACLVRELFAEDELVVVEQEVAHLLLVSKYVAPSLVLGQDRKRFLADQRAEWMKHLW